MKHCIWILIFTILVACDNDETVVLSQGEINGQRLMQATEGKTINTIVLYWTAGDTYFQELYIEPVFNIDGSFFQIEDTYYNLDKLVRFIEYENRIDLYFE
ncbi:MAG: hypothetical protein AAF519_11185 [Bacteroidota bacterium]